MHELDALLGGGGSLTGILAKAAGRLAELTLPAAAGFRLATQAAATDWRELVALAGAESQLRDDGPPGDWEEAAGRLMDVAQAGARARLAPAARAEATRAETAQPPAAAPRTLRDLPPGSVAKLTAVKTESSAAGARAADAIVLQPLTMMAAMTAEAAPPPPANDVEAVRRL
eukprot:5506332-Pleurochrysis_carterae.AAC.2